MLFNSYSFAVFFPVTTLAYFLLPHRFRWMLLLAASCVFYMAFIPVYILILAFLIIVDYAAGLLIEKSQGKRRKLFLITSLISNLGILGLFKYFNFLDSNLSALASFIHWNYSLHALSLVLPIGLSFHTFQAMSYTIEVYRGRVKAERHFGFYALYVMFYPQLVAGPIERPQNLLHQLHEEHSFDYERVTHGLKRMAWGLFKKVVIADRLAFIVNQFYTNPSQYTGPFLMLGTLAFSFQIYCDFSGYSEIAIGAAEVMGIKLMENFNAPYFAESISEFWRRWHISLSTWFRDYVYIPLGGNQVGARRYALNILIVFLLSGLWHGANWTFVIWGALHGFYLLLYRMLAPVRRIIASHASSLGAESVYHACAIGVTFCLTTFAWIFFRANTVSDAFTIATHLFTGYGALDIGAVKQIAVSRSELILALVFVGLLLVVEIRQKREGILLTISQKPLWIRWGTYYALALSLMFFGIFNASKFIYFQF